jgi:FkbM family methyltransferase
MNKILELYKYMANNENGFDRFVDEVFDAEIYKRASPQLNIIDLGAFQGEYSFSCLPFAKHVWAVEPDPIPYAKLVEMVEKFDLKDKISTYPFGIYNINGKKNFSATHQGGSAIEEYIRDSHMDIDVLTLNTFMEQEKIDSVDILKIDVESSEKSIFTAPDFKIASQKIKFIIGEPHAGEEVRGPLEAVGYQVDFWPEHTFTAHR